MPSRISRCARRRTAADNRVDLYLKGSATLIRLPKLAAELEKLKPGANVHVHIGDLDYIDHACLDLLSNWDRQHAATGGSVTIEWDELSKKYHQRRVVQHEGRPRSRRRQGLALATRSRTDCILGLARGPFAARLERDRGIARMASASPRMTTRCHRGRVTARRTR